MRFFRIPSFTGIEAHRDDADRGSLRMVEGCLPHGPGGLRSGPVWKKVGDVQYVANGDQNKISAGDDGLGNSLIFVSRNNEVHDLALETTEHTELDAISSQYEITFADPSLYTDAPANITPIGNKLYAVGDGSFESVFVGKGPDSTFEVFPDENLYSQEWSRFPKCQFFVQGPKKTIFAAGNPDKPLTIYISEPAGLTSPYRDTPYSTEDTTYNQGALSTVNILGSNASKITALSTRGDQVVVHTDKGCHLLYAPAPDQANTGYRVEQAPATNFSAAVNSKVVSRASGALTYWVGHDGQVYKDEAASRGSEDLRSRADEDQANWKSKGVWEDELPTDLTRSFAVYSPQTGMYWFFVESEEKKTFDLIPRTPMRGPFGLIARILAPYFGPTDLDAYVLAPYSGPKDLNAYVIPPRSGAINLQASVIPPAAGPTNLTAEVLLPNSGPTNLTAEILRPYRGPTNLTALVLPPSEGPVDLTALVLPPNEGPVDLIALEELEILPPNEGPVDLTALVLPPSEGPVDLTALVLPPSEGPVDLTALVLPPNEGPVDLTALVLPPNEGPVDLTALVLPPNEGPVDLTALVLPPSEGPTDLTALVLPPNEGPTDLTALVLPPNEGPIDLTAEVLPPVGGPTGLSAIEKLGSFTVHIENVMINQFSSKSGYSSYENLTTNRTGSFLVGYTLNSNAGDIMSFNVTAETNHADATGYFEKFYIPPEVTFNPGNDPYWDSTNRWYYGSQVKGLHFNQTAQVDIFWSDNPIAPYIGPTNLTASIESGEAGGGEDTSTESKYISFEIAEDGVYTQQFGGGWQGDNLGYPNPGGVVKVSEDPPGTSDGLSFLQGNQVIEIGGRNGHAGSAYTPGVIVRNDNGYFDEHTVYTVSAEANDEWYFTRWDIQYATTTPASERYPTIGQPRGEVQIISGSLEDPTDLILKVTDASNYIVVRAQFTDVNPNPDPDPDPSPDPMYFLDNCQCLSDNGSGTGDFATFEECEDWKAVATFNCENGECVEDDMQMGTYSTCAECQANCSGGGSSEPCDDVYLDYNFDCTYAGPDMGVLTQCDCDMSNP